MTSGASSEEMEGLGLDARRAVMAAQDAARSLGHDRVGTEHVLLGLLTDPAVGQILRDAGATDGAARRKVTEAIPAGPSSQPGRALPRSARCERAIGRAARFARDAHAELVGCPHLLLGVLDVEGTAGQVLRGLGVDLEQVRGALSGPSTTPHDMPEEPPSTSSAPVRCPSCEAPLSGGLAGTLLPVSVDGRDGARVLAVVCPACGTLLGVTSAG